MATIREEQIRTNSSTTKPQATIRSKSKRNKKKPITNAPKVDMKRSGRSSNWQSFKSKQTTTTSVISKPIILDTGNTKPIIGALNSQKIVKSNTNKTKTSLEIKKTLTTPQQQNNNHIVRKPEANNTKMHPYLLPPSLDPSFPNSLPPEPVPPIQFVDTGALCHTDMRHLQAPGVVSLNGVRPIIQSDPCVAIDCEMVGVATGKESMLARVSLVNMSGLCVYDTFVAPQARVVDYRTAVSGVRPHNLYYGADFNVVRQVVATLIHNRILVGHAIQNDLDALGLKFPRKFIRDTAYYKPFRVQLGIDRPPSLKKLAKEILKIDIQGSEHSSIEDAYAAMQLYKMFNQDWERQLREKKQRG